MGGPGSGGVARYLATYPCDVPFCICAAANGRVTFAAFSSFDMNYDPIILIHTVSAILTWDTDPFFGCWLIVVAHTPGWCLV